MGSLYCGICNKTFQKNIQLQNHIRNHRAERRFVCTYCNKGKKYLNYYLTMKINMSNELSYTCFLSGFTCFTWHYNALSLDHLFIFNTPKHARGTGMPKSYNFALYSVRGLTNGFIYLLFFDWKKIFFYFSLVSRMIT